MMKLTRIVEHVPYQDIVGKEIIDRFVLFLTIIVWKEIPVQKVRPEYGDEQADAGRDG